MFPNCQHNSGVWQGEMAHRQHSTAQTVVRYSTDARVAPACADGRGGRFAGVGVNARSFWFEKESQRTTGVHKYISKQYRNTTRRNRRSAPECTTAHAIQVQYSSLRSAKWFVFDSCMSDGSLAPRKAVQAKTICTIILRYCCRALHEKPCWQLLLPGTSMRVENVYEYQ